MKDDILIIDYPDTLRVRDPLLEEAAKNVLHQLRVLFDQHTHPTVGGGPKSPPCAYCGEYSSSGKHGPQCRFTTDPRYWTLPGGARDITRQPLIANELVEVCPMEVPRSLLLYLDYQYDKAGPVARELPRCECGAGACGSTFHSDWCPLA